MTSQLTPRESGEPTLYSYSQLQKADGFLVRDSQGLEVGVGEGRSSTCFFRPDPALSREGGEVAFFLSLSTGCKVSRVRATSDLQRGWYCGGS